MILTGAVVLISVFANLRAQTGECDIQHVFDATTKGEIKSPGYDRGGYYADLSCEYKITAPEGYSIKLTFLDLDIDPVGSCGFDSLTIMGQRQESKLGTYCGQLIPFPVMSNENENEIEMSFKSDHIVHGRGFRIQYESAPGLEACGGNERQCRNRNCYKNEKHCDGIDDCGDGTDEEDCGKPVALPNDDKCGQPIVSPLLNAADRQVGGVEAIPNSWPWQVSLQYTDVEPNGHYCGGTLISPQWVVSAAHCVQGIKKPSDLRIVLGAHNKYKKTNYQATRIAKRIIAYPDLEGEQMRFLNMPHDLALIKLNAPVIFNDGIQPACIPHLGWEARTGMNCYSSGWGETRGSGFSDVLKQTVQVIQDDSDCIYDKGAQICVNKKFNSPCHGDSGGPLVCNFGGKWYVMGATSYSTSGNYLGGLCGLPESRVIFAKVADKADWIRQLVQKF